MLERELPKLVDRQLIEPKIVDDDKQGISWRKANRLKRRRLAWERRRKTRLALELLHRRRERNLEELGCYCVEEDEHDDECPVQIKFTQHNNGSNCVIL